MLTDEEPSSPKRRLWQVVRAVAFVWVGLTLFLALTQRSMMYFPTRLGAEEARRAAEHAGLSPWTAPSGETIGYVSAAAPDDPRPPASVLVIHGNAGHTLHRADYIPILRRAAPGFGLSVHLMEYPGYGAREGNPSQQSFLAAASEAVQALPPGQPAIILGESIGTGTACAMAAEHPDKISGLLLLTPFDSLVSVAQHHYPLLPVRWILRDTYPSADWLRTYRGRGAIVVAGRDEIVPAIFGRRLAEAYAGPKLLLEIPDADHNTLLHAMTPDDWRKALEFLLPGDAPR